MTVSEAFVDIRITRALGRVVVTPHGALDGQAAPQLRHLLADLIEGQGNLDVVIDARYIARIEGDAADVLVDASVSARRLGGALRVSAPPPQVCARLDGSKLTICLAPRA